MKLRSFCLLAAILLVTPAYAQIAVPSDGSDGPFNPSANVTVDLSAAVTARWDTNNAANAGKGVYDSEKWAVVFKYQSVSIPSNVTVKFKNHPANAPVVWLVQGDVVINGSVDVGAQGSHGSTILSVPGPGGFRGGASGLSSQRAAGGGFGPGGGGNPANVAPSGSFGTRGTHADAGITYGSAQVLPLIGGSGGSGRSGADGRQQGGAGGGAIVIAARGTITINGSILAGGFPGFDYSGSGSGGAIRLLANTVAGTTGVLNTRGGVDNVPGGLGRVRIEANSSSNFLTIFGESSGGLPNPVSIWLPEDGPTARVVSVNAAPAPLDPRSSLEIAPDVSINTTSEVDVIVETMNVPSSWEVKVRITPRYGNPIVQTATFVTFTDEAQTKATWKAKVTLPPGYCAIQARAALK